VGLPALDRNSVIPLYYQIRQSLLEEIRSGSLKAGEPVPSEQEISAHLGVSRMTARQALKSLCSLGLTYSQRGKGTFVSQNKVEKNFRQVLSFTEEMKARGFRPRSKVLGFKAVTATEQVADALRLAPHEKVIRLKRIRLADSLPMAVECTCIPLSLCPDLVETFDPSTSLYDALSQRYAIRITTAEEVVEVGRAGSEDARLLRIPRGSAIFLFTRTSFLESGEPVEYVRSVYRGDRYKFVHSLTQPSRDNSARGRN
jgi:GntR family transcriptional regulator